MDDEQLVLPAEEPSNAEPMHRTSEQDRVPILTKFAYGLGGLTDFFYLNVLLGLANQIYVTGMKLDPALLGIALAIPKALGAIADPIVGASSDNARGAWGRRRPFILFGGLAGAILLPLMWCVPPGSQIVRFAYVAGLISVFSACYSVFSACLRGRGIFRPSARSAPRGSTGFAVAKCLATWLLGRGFSALSLV